jgi:hypothetical protein
MKGENIVKRAIKVSVHFLKLHFCMFEKSQVSIIIWIFIILLEYFSLITKLTCSKLETNQKCFCMFKAFKPWEWIVLVFFRCLFFLPNVHHFFWKLERILTLMTRRTKGLDLMKIIIIINLSTFGSKVLWPWKLWMLKMCFWQKFMFMW